MTLGLLGVRSRRGRADDLRVELHPTAPSWRIALLTAIGAGALTAAACVAIATGQFAPVMWWLIALAGLATFVPAVGTLSAAVEVDHTGVTVLRFGRMQQFRWDEIVDLGVVERRALVADGTEYHWVWPTRRHMVAVPYLQLVDGTRRELPALSAPTGTGRAVADAHADRIRAQGANAELVTTSS